MPNKHAVLSASSSARWLACPPSAQLCAALPDTVTDYALEGTCAHELAEYKVQKLLGNPASNPVENLDFYDTEMEDCTDSYAQYIAELLANLQEPMRLRDCCRFRSNRYRLQVWQGRGGVCRPQLADDAVRSGGVGTVRCPL